MECMVEIGNITIDLCTFTSSLSWSCQDCGLNNTLHTFSLGLNLTDVFSGTSELVSAKLDIFCSFTSGIHLR